MVEKDRPAPSNDHPDRGDGWWHCGRFAYVDRAGGRVVTAVDLGTPGHPDDGGDDDGLV